jgi:hypothetical protein
LELAQKVALIQFFFSEKFFFEKSTCGTPQHFSLAKFRHGPLQSDFSKKNFSLKKFESMQLFVLIPNMLFILLST